jgi:GntR family transcriptional regulator, transcriptional repressor for pyruvate dehydrogenase complex
MKDRSRLGDRSAARRRGMVRVPKTGELVARELRRRIVRGELSEGDSLPSESELVEEFGVSRPTMREAFRILETEQLISVSRGSRGGARVHLPEVEVVSRYAGVYLQSRNTTLADVFAARLIIEPAAARMVAERRPSRLIAELNRQISVIEANIEDPDAYARHVAEFHVSLIEGSGNETLSLIARVINDIWAAHARNVVGTRYVVELAKTGLKSEKKLMAFIEAGNADGAEAQWRSHLENVGRIILKRFSGKSIVEVLS